MAESREDFGFPLWSCRQKRGKCSCPKQQPWETITHREDAKWISGYLPRSSLRAQHYYCICVALKYLLYCECLTLFFKSLAILTFTPVTPNLDLFKPLSKVLTRRGTFSGILLWRSSSLDLHITIKMSTKHYFPETAVNTLVPRALTSLVAAIPELALITDQRVVLNTNHKTSQVALISGGGSGHEPAWYVLKKIDLLPPAHDPNLSLKPHKNYFP